MSDTDVPNPETVTTCAVFIEGEVWALPRPARHAHILRAWFDAHGKTQPVPGHKQGFMTSMRRFVGREEAMRIALAAKQEFRARAPLTDRLYSEDLW